jgi:hypothetical protein
VDKVDKVIGKGLSTNDYDDNEKLINYDTDVVFSSTGIEYPIDSLSDTRYGILKSKLILPATPTDTVGQEFLCRARYSKDGSSYYLYVIIGAIGDTAYHIIRTIGAGYFDNSKSNYAATTSDMQSDWNNKLSLNWDSVSDVYSFLTNNSFLDGKKNKRVLKVNLSDDSNQALSFDTKGGLLVDKTQFATPSDLSAGLSGKVDKETGKSLISDSDITRLADTSGTNTGDQDLSGYATTSSVTTALADKVDKVSGYGLIADTANTFLGDYAQGRKYLTLLIM